MDTIRYVDLFCGIGSFHYASRDKWQCVFACDINEDCRKTYELNYGMKPEGDITKVDVASVPQFDVLCAGFPCQPFSNAGQHRGFSDTRGSMFGEVMRFVHYHAPKVVILENVPALESHDDGNTLHVIIKSLNDAGMNVVMKVLRCSDYGIPQMRKRLFIVASTISLPEDTLEFPIRNTVDLTDFLNEGREGKDRMTFTKKKVAYTIRCGGGAVELMISTIGMVIGS